MKELLFIIFIDYYDEVTTFEKRNINIYEFLYEFKSHLQ